MDCFASLMATTVWQQPNIFATPCARCVCAGDFLNTLDTVIHHTALATVPTWCIEYSHA